MRLTLPKNAAAPGLAGAEKDIRCVLILLGPLPCGILVKLPGQGGV